jgi:hypothetical protein
VAKQESQQKEQQLYDAQQRLLAEEAQDQAIIKAAMQCSAQRKARLNSPTLGQPATDDQPQKTSLMRGHAPTRQDELRLAALTNDRELLRAKSDQVKSETPSEDEESEVLTEVPASRAAQHLFSESRNSINSLRDHNV